MRARPWRMSTFETDWQPGSSIRITAEIGGRQYRDKGTAPRVSGLTHPGTGQWSHFEYRPTSPLA